jgi:hypothetical protein
MARRVSGSRTTTNSHGWAFIALPVRRAISRIAPSASSETGSAVNSRVFRTRCRVSSRPRVSLMGPPGRVGESASLERGRAPVSPVIPNEAEGRVSGSASLERMAGHHDGDRSFAPLCGRAV